MRELVFVKGSREATSAGEKVTNDEHAVQPAEAKTLCTAKHLWLNQRHYVQRNISGSSKDTMYRKTSLAKPKKRCTAKHFCEPKTRCTAKHLCKPKTLCTAKHLWLNQRHYVQENISGSGRTKDTMCRKTSLAEPKTRGTVLETSL